MNKIKFGIIGCGRIGERHASHIQNFGELTSVCDIKEDRARKVGSLYGARIYQDYKKLLMEENEIDVIAICTPNGLHAEHSIASLHAKKHTICEKPMATNSKDCEDMIQAAEQNHKNLFVVKQNRYNPPVVAVKKLIAENKLGVIFNVQLNCFWNRTEQYYKESDWKGTKDLDGGTLFTQFSHFVDLLLWLIGKIEKVKVIRKNFLHNGIINFEDTGVIILEFCSGAIGTINYTINSYRKNMEGSLTIFGEKGTVKIGGQYLNVLEYQNIEDYEIEKIPIENKTNEYGFYQGSMSNHDKVYANVVSVLSGKEEIATTGKEGAEVVKLIELIYSQSKL